MSGDMRRSVPEIAATLIYAVSVTVAIGVTLWLIRVVFLAPGDTVGFLFRVLETRFLPTTLVVLLGCWSVALIRLPPVWLRLLCAPMAAWGVYALTVFVP
jgi:hypothetical protein